VTVAQAVDHVAAATSTTLTSIGDHVQLTAFDARDNAVTATVTWSPATGTVATVDQNGVVTAVGNGSVAIQGSAGGKSASILITVAQVVVSVDVSVVSGTAMFASLGQTATLAATARDARGNAISGASFTWSSDNAAVADVSSAGVVTAKANGTAHIFATSGGIQNADPGFAVTVSQVIASVVVSPSNPSVFTSILSQTVTFSAQANDANQNPVANAPAATWQSSDPSTASIDVNTGLATGHKPGSVTITATISTVPGSTTLTVIQYP
jgi:uncharacterized protein YjdB